MSFTQILPEYPGYYYRSSITMLNKRLCWEPVEGWYSPPKFEIGVKKMEIALPQDFLPEEMGYVIGKKGIHFKWITEKSKTLYIFYRKETGKIEIWGQSDETIGLAVHLLYRHFNHLRQKRNSQF